MDPTQPPEVDKAAIRRENGPPAIICKNGPKDQQVAGVIFCTMHYLKVFFTGTLTCLAEGDLLWCTNCDARSLTARTENQGIRTPFGTKMLPAETGPQPRCKSLEKPRHLLRGVRASALAKVAAKALSRHLACSGNSRPAQGGQARKRAEKE